MRSIGWLLLAWSSLGCGARPLPEVKALKPGKAPPVVLVHGLLAHAGHWKGHPLTEALDGPVLAVSLRGRGQSPNPAPGGFHPTRQAEDIRDALDVMGARRGIIVAHSMGVPVALAFAQRWPERVSALVMGDYVPGWVRLTPAWRDLASKRTRAGVPADFPARIQADQATWGEAGITITLSAEHAEVLAPDLRSVLKTLRVPVLVLLGRQSAEPSVEALWAGPTTTVQWIEAGHAIYRHPEAVRATVDAVSRSRRDPPRR